MPSRILPGCSSPGCPDRSVAGGRGRCEKHRAASSRAHDQERGSSSERGYGHAWRKLRLWFLAHHPLCEDCEKDGLVTEAQHVDHRIARAKGGTDDESNLRALCQSCHSRKTALEDGGLGLAPARAGVVNPPRSRERAGG